MVDFSFLRQQGIELVQQLCGESWTDYNLHDPGVTILEALCYAITDLSYRTEFPMADLLAGRDGKIRLEQNAFFIREDILSSNPVTVNDFRKYILDKMDNQQNLHNVWLEPFISGYSYGTMHGLYTMKIQVRREFSTQLMPTASPAPPPTDDSEWAKALKKEVRACFVSGRNLCEDLIMNITVLRPVSIRIKAEVIVTGDNPELLLATIYRDLEAAINPPIKYYTEQELLDKGYRVEDIHTGPVLKKGFIPDGELPPRKSSIDPAELMKIISQVPGVSYVRNLLIFTPESPERPEGPAGRIPYILPEGTYPYFEHGLSESPIRLLKDKYEIHIRESVFNDIWLRVKEAARRSAEPVVDSLASSRIRHGQYRDVQFYHSLQHLFPIVYGIGADGLGQNPSPERIAGARQLKAYLLFFEQILANYLAQLANVSGFFSFDDGGAQTYYTQPLYQVPDIQPLLRAFTDRAAPDDAKAWSAFTGDSNNGYMRALAEGSESYETWCERRNVVLDHLLARFNERTSSYPVRLYAELYDERDKQKRQDDVIEWKSGLLKNMVKTGYGRVRGFNYLAREGDDKGGFYNKMAALLYIRPATAEHTLLSDVVLQKTTFRPASATPPPASAATPPSAATTPPPAAPDQHKQEWVTVADSATMRQRISKASAARHRANNPDPAPGPAANPAPSWNFSDRKMSFFRHGLNAGNYTIGPDTYWGRGWLILFREPAENSWQIISRHADEPAAVIALKQLIAQLRQISILSEGFYIVEHVLLRPIADSPSFGFRFYATKTDLLLQHTRWTSFTERERILTSILHAAETAPSPAAVPDAGMTEWGVKNLGNQCRVQLTRHKEYGFMGDPVDLEPWVWKETAPDFEYIRQQLLLFKEDKLRFYPRFEMLVKGKEDSQIREEFFNFNMTVVFPAWPARFQDPNFRLFAMDLFRIHTPAHIRLYFQWLNISRMKEFEHLYTNWTVAMKNPDDLGPRKQWSDQVIHFLKKGIY